MGSLKVAPVAAAPATVGPELVENPKPMAQVEFVSLRKDENIDK